MKRKYKPTGCAKFLLFLVIFAPLAYIGASLFRGENPKDNFQNLFHIEKKDSPAKSNSKKDPLLKEIENLENIIKSKDREIERLEKRIDQLENQ